VLSCQIGDLHRQLKKSNEGLSTHKVQANHEAALIRRETSARGEELSRLENDNRLLETRYNRETSQLRNGNRLEKMKHVVRRWQHVQLHQSLMGWLKNLWASTGMGSGQRQKMREESEGMKRDSVRVQSQLDNTQQEVSRMMQTISAELAEVTKAKAILSEEVLMVQAERAQIREVVALSKKAAPEGGPQAAELALLRAELLALKERKDREEIDAGSRQRAGMRPIKEGRDSATRSASSRERSGSRDRAY